MKAEKMFSQKETQKEKKGFQNGYDIYSFLFICLREWLIFLVFTYFTYPHEVYPETLSLHNLPSVFCMIAPNMRATAISKNF